MDHGSEFLPFPGQIVGEPGLRHLHGLEARVGQPADHLRIGQHGVHLRRDAQGDRRGRARGQQQALPGLDVQRPEFRRLGQARHLGQRGGAPPGRHAIGLHLALADEGLGQRHGQHRQVDLPARQFGQHLRAGLVGNVGDVEPCLLLDRLGGDVQAGADAVRAEVEPAGLAADEADQFCRVRCQTGPADQHEGRGCHRYDRLQFLESVVGEACRRHQRRDRDRAGHPEQQGVAIGPGPDHPLDGDGARGPHRVLDDHGLLQPLGQPGHQQPGGHVHAAAGRERHDRDDGLGGPGGGGAVGAGRRCGGGQRGQRGQGERPRGVGQAADGGHGRGWRGGKRAAGEAGRPGAQVFSQGRADAG